VKIEMDDVSNPEYYQWLDGMRRDIGDLVPGAEIAEKPGARDAPPLNTAVYYDTTDYQILPTGALLRTSCNIITHAFCAFKAAEDIHGVRGDYRYVFDGEEKGIIQRTPTSPEAVVIVHTLLRRTDIEHPGTYLRAAHGIDPTALLPAICLHDLRYTFFVWLDKRDALRCSLDRARVSDLRLPDKERVETPVSEVELAIYPHLEPAVASDPRIVRLVEALRESLCGTFGARTTREIKYQRAARALGMRR
jgi:hypothetical protein